MNLDRHRSAPWLVFVNRDMLRQDSGRSLSQKEVDLILQANSPRFVPLGPIVDLQLVTDPDATSFLYLNNGENPA